jgi:acyl carrier protein
MKADQEVLGKIVEILQPFVSGGVEITPGMDIESDLAIDSLKSMEILANLEDVFDISIPINVLSEVRTVDDLAVQIQKLVEAEK